MFQPRDLIELLGTFSNVRSLIQCSMKCNLNRQCRTFDYDQSSLVCRLFEGEFSTGTVLSNFTALSSRIGAILYNTTLAHESYLSYNHTCDQCSSSENRYLQCLNNTCQCPLHTYWNGQMCLNQLYNGSNCSSSLSCRQDFNLTCSNQSKTCNIPPTPAWQTIAFQQPAVTYATNSGPIAVVSADFNKDGHADVAVTNYYGNSVSILLGIGNGSFKLPAMSFASNGTHPYWLDTADFNGDGNLDLAMCNEGSDTIAVLLGQNNGSFQLSAVAFASGGLDPSSLIAADFNNDNKIDLAVADTASYTIAIFLGTGNGTFQVPGTFYSAGAFPSFITKGDYNADGNIDLAVVSRASNQLIIFSGFGNGAFQSNFTSYATGSTPYVVRTADFNGDSKLDLVVGNSNDNTISIFIGTGTGTFVVPSPSTYSAGISRPMDIAIQDLNGDSKMDLAVCSYSSNNIVLYLGNGNGTFSEQKILSSMGQNPSSVIAQDFNEDGKYDLATANINDNILAILLA